jgi:hypothetical protein
MTKGAERVRESYGTSLAAGTSPTFAFLNDKSAS